MVRYQVPRPDLGRVLRVSRRERLANGRLFVSFRPVADELPEPEPLVCPIDSPEAKVLMEEPALFDAGGLGKMGQRFYPARRVVNGWLALIGDADRPTHSMA